jgi:two-component system chemotaxis response regulator CheY
MAKILVTDDSDFMREFIDNIVGEAGHEVFQAKDGQEMLDVYDDIQPDVVFLDIVMPEMSGLTAFEKLQQKDPDAKVVVCSVLGGQDAIVQRALQQGAKDFICKPFDTDHILATIAKVAG